MNIEDSEEKSDSEISMNGEKKNGEKKEKKEVEIKFPHKGVLIKKGFKHYLVKDKQIN